MQKVRSLQVPRDTCYGSVRSVLSSTLLAVQADYGEVSLISVEDGSLQSYVSHGALPEREAGLSVAHWVATHGQPLVLETQEEVALLVPELIINHREALPLICVPIQIHSTTLGALQSNILSATSHRELVQRQHTLKLAASLIGHVIENRGLQRRLEETKVLLQNLNKITLELQEAERERIILDVHDGIAQTLASAFQYLQTFDNAATQATEKVGESQVGYLRQLFKRAVSLIRQAIQETREIVSSVTPATLDVLGLVTTLREELKHFEKETGCKVDFRLAAWPSLPRHMEFTIYRIIHEAVNNVSKHAKSPGLEVELRQEQKRLVIRVKDWGIGFAPDKKEPSPSNRPMGFWSMRRRAEFLGGTVTINSSLGKGTEIMVGIPWLTEGD